MEAQIRLDPADFEHREWVALAWAREWALTRGKVENAELLEEYESLYNKRERRDILAVVTAMDFANRFMNTLTGNVLELQ